MGSVRLCMCVRYVKYAKGSAFYVLHSYTVKHSLLKDLKIIKSSLEN